MDLNGSSPTDTFIQKTRKLYIDAKSQPSLNKANEGLKDVSKIIAKNIQDIINRGGKIDGELLFLSSH